MRHLERRGPGSIPGVGKPWLLLYLGSLSQHFGDRRSDCFFAASVVVSLVLWLLHPPNTREVPSLSLARNSFCSSPPGKADISCCHRLSTQEKKWGARESGSTICFKLLNDGRLWNFFTRRHRFHDSAQTNKEKVHLGIWPFYHWKPVPFLAIVLCRNEAVLWRDWRARIDSQVFCVTHFPTGKVLEAFRRTFSFLLTFESLIKFLITVQCQKWAKKGSMDLRVKHQSDGLLWIRDSKSFLGDILWCSRLGWVLYSAYYPVLLTCAEKSALDRLIVPNFSWTVEKLAGNSAT